MRKFSAGRSFKKYSGHTKAMRKINKVKRGGLKKKHTSGGCIVFIALLLSVPIILV